MDANWEDHLPEDEARERWAAEQPLYLLGNLTGAQVRLIQVAVRTLRDLGGGVESAYAGLGELIEYPVEQTRTMDDIRSALYLDGNDEEQVT
jgi:hypothetical protein